MTNPRTATYRMAVIQQSIFLYFSVSVSNIKKLLTNGVIIINKLDYETVFSTVHSSESSNSSKSGSHSGSDSSESYLRCFFPWFFLDVSAKKKRILDIIITVRQTCVTKN